MHGHTWRERPQLGHQVEQVGIMVELRQHDHRLRIRLAGEREIALDPPRTEILSVGDQESGVDVGRDHLPTGRAFRTRAAARERRSANQALDNESAARLSGEGNPVTDDRPLPAASLPTQIRREPHLLLPGSGEDAQRGAEIDRHPTSPKPSALKSNERNLKIDAPAESRQAILNRNFRDRPLPPSLSTNKKRVPEHTIDTRLASGHCSPLRAILT